MDQFAHLSGYLLQHQIYLYLKICCQLLHVIERKLCIFQPVDMPDPYTPPRKRCLLCVHNVKLDYKVRRQHLNLLVLFCGFSAFELNVVFDPFSRKIASLCRHTFHILPDHI